MLKKKYSRYFVFGALALAFLGFQNCSVHVKPLETIIESIPDETLVIPPDTPPPPGGSNPFFSDAVSLSAGEAHTCAAKSTGEVFCWGDNEFGQLGNSSKISSSTPVQISIGMNADQVASSLNFSCAVSNSENTIKCWGMGINGIKTIAQSPKITGIKKIVFPRGGLLGAEGQLGITEYFGYFCATRDDQYVVCATILSGGGPQEPKVLDGLSSVIDITSSGYIPRVGDGFYVISNGSLMFISASENFQVYGFSGASGVTSPKKFFHDLVLTDNGGFVLDYDHPEEYVPLKFLTGIEEISYTIINQNNTSKHPAQICMRRTNGSVTCSGVNSSGQLGTGAFDDGTFGFKEVVDIGNATAIASGLGHTCAIDSDRFVKCWGNNFRG